MKFLSKFFEKMKKNKTTIGNGILYNKYLLYFFLLISFTDLLYYAIAKKYIFIIIFFIIGYLTHFFSKNMIVIMCIALVFTNILSFGTSKRSIVNEGFKEGAKSVHFAEPLEKSLEENKVVNKKETKVKTIKLENMDNTATKSLSNLQNQNEGESGIGGLSEKTMELMKTQQELMKNMETLAPMLKHAEGFLEKFKEGNKDKKKSEL